VHCGIAELHTFWQERHGPFHRSSPLRHYRGPDRAAMG
jgi:hypothetical protein